MWNQLLEKWPRLVPLSILLSVLALYGRTLGYEYIWDDSLLFLDKTALINEPLSWALLSQPVLPGTTYFRPLMFLTMFLEFNLVGQEPMLSHAVNVAIFMANALLVYLLAGHLARTLGLPSVRLRAWLAALLYVVHPSLVEPVAWISGRFDLLVTLFMLLGLYFAVLDIRPLLKLLLVSLSMMAGLLSKELAVVMPALLVCYWLACYGREFSSPFAALQQAFVQNSLLLSGMLFTFAIYMVLRIDAVNGVYHAQLTENYMKIAWFERRLPLEAMKYYLQHSFLPFSGISPMHPADNIDLLGWQSRITAWLAGLFVLGLFAWAFFKRTAASWLLVAWLACITPVLHIVPLSILDNVAHDRFLTAALAFWALAVVVVPYERVLAFMQEHSRQFILKLSAGAWVFLALITTLSVLPMWASELRLWHWAYQDHSQLNVVRYNYLYAALRESRTDILVKEVDGWIESGKGLDVGEQLLYANYLIRTGDIEGKRYLEGVLYALPAFHDMPEGRFYADRFYLTSLQMGSAYADYANALLVFDGDAEQALKYNRIAAWYQSESEQIPLKYQRAAIYYALNDFEGAEAILEELKGLYHYRQEMQEKSLNILVQKFCEVNAFDTESCRRMLENNMIERVEETSS